MNKRSVIKKLLKQAEGLWKESCRLRDGNKCQGFKMEPDHVCAGVLQVDHCFSRKVSQLFLDLGNGTTICMGLHFRKTHLVKGAEKRVDEFVRAREGEAWWDYANQVCLSKKPHIWDATELELKIQFFNQWITVLKKPHRSKNENPIGSAALVKGTGCRNETPTRTKR